MSGIGEIIALQISNLRCIKFANLTFDPKSGELVTIAGPNDSGKSTILDAIKFAIEGAANIPEGVIRHGLYSEGPAAGQPIDRSLIRVQTTKGYTIERVIRTNNKGEQVAELQVIKEGEGKVPSAQNFLWSVSSKFPDPTVVADLDSKTLFRGIADMLKIDLDKYDHDIEQEKERAKAARQRQKTLGVIDQPEGDPVEPVDVAALSKEFYEKQREFDEKNTQAKSLTERKAFIERKIAELKEQIEREKDSLTEVCEELENFEPPNTEELNAIEKRLTSANVINQLAEDWKNYNHYILQREQLEHELTESREAVQAIEEARNLELQKAELPAGIYLEDGMVKADQGILWDSLSTSRKLTAATELCIHSIPEGALRYLYIQRGESLGTERKGIIAKIAKEKNVQVFMEVMTEDEDGTIRIKNGEVVLSSPQASDPLDIF